MVIKITTLTEADIPGAVKAVHIRMRWGMRNGIFHVAKEEGSDEVLGVACWLRPQPAGQPPTWHDWLEGWRLYFGQRYYIWKDAQAKIQSELWDDPRGYYFLNIMVVLPSAQGKGVGAAMMNAVTEKADAENIKCYLESSRDVPNVAIYGRWGFKFVKDMTCDDDGDAIKLFSMIREPHAQPGNGGEPYFEVRWHARCDSLAQPFQTCLPNQNPRQPGVIMAHKEIIQDGRRPVSDERASFLNPASSTFLSAIHDAIIQDPGLPRLNPTTSSWQVPEHPTLASIQSPQLPSRTDFAVIGSGITGCSVARALLAHHAEHVTVLEARTLVSGATGRNGGHLVTAAGHTYGPLARRWGVEAARQITRFSIMNVEELMKMVREMDVDVQEECQIRDVLKVMAVGDEDTWAAAKSSVLNFQNDVPEHAKYHRIIEKDDVPEKWNIKNSCGAVEHEAGAIWPYRLITRIYEKLLRDYPQRFSIETNTPVTQVKFLPEAADEQYRYSVVTPRGTILAKRVVHCTNAYASHLLPALTGGLYPFRGTMSVQKPGPLLKDLKGSRSWSLAHKEQLDAEAGFYETGLYYMQQNPLTARIWIGNESAYLKDILTSDDTFVPPEARQALSTVLPKFFLEGWGAETVSEIESIWSGIQGHTADGLPVVGQVPASVTGNPDDKGQWMAAGFNGYGMDKCWLTGQALVNMMFGEDVSGWFPRCYLITETRLREELNPERTVAKFAKVAFPNDHNDA
ncbi:hypothetical protein S40288_03674 [Stachybotrys chartarum IBT 40288]|nr:hypothetical protein S40288_03674 [Stachybotrys chartarum IBT 40288]